MGDYPSDLDIMTIESWPFEDADDMLSFFRFVKSIWWAADWGWHEEETRDMFDRDVMRYRISTGGWSGNEDIIRAMQKNENWLWPLTWQQSTRGGHYVFELALERVPMED